MKKLVRFHPIRKYNKLFKFLTFDLSFLSCIIIAIIIISYMAVVSQLFSLSGIAETNITS